MDQKKNSATGLDDQIATASGIVRPASRWEDTFGIRGNAQFANTRWTIVVRAQEGTELEVAEAMSQLCRSYWYPLYAYVRRSGRRREEAEDLTQEFFARYLLEKDILASAAREKGKLRTFLLTVMKRFLIKDWQRAHAEKRGGGREHVPINFDEGEDRYGHEPADNTTPDELYEKQWATTLLGRVMDSLRLEYASRGAEDRFDALKDALWWNANESSYSKLGETLELSENAVKQAVSRLRKQYRKQLKEEIRSTLDTEDEEAVDTELSYLIAVLRKN
jgi:RNA polymerase sigma factor (sigma-70 family)